jgi:riboflavin synthase
MFTGIVTARGTVSRVEGDGDRLAITIEGPYTDLQLGESIAVDGACLTVVDLGPGWFRVEAVATTRERTCFGDFAPGVLVNLERAMMAGDRFGGHLVQGHVDGVGEVVRVRWEADALLLDITVPEEVADVTVLHGSITVNGVSLTVNDIPEPAFVQVSLIPYTRDHTTLGELRPGDRVHLEADVIGKYVRQVLLARGDVVGSKGE